MHLTKTPAIRVRIAGAEYGSGVPGQHISVSSPKQSSDQPRLVRWRVDDCLRVEVLEVAHA